MIKDQLNSINPKNNLKINSWNIHSHEEIESIIRASGNAQTSWGELRLESRINLLKKLSLIIKERSKKMSIMMADEMGKPIKEGQKEIIKCILLCDYYIESSNQ